MRQFRAIGLVFGLSSALPVAAAPRPTEPPEVGQRPELSLVWPTSIALEPDGSLLVVENGARTTGRSMSSKRV